MNLCHVRGIVITNDSVLERRGYSAAARESAESDRRAGDALTAERGTGGSEVGRKRGAAGALCISRKVCGC